MDQSDDEIDVAITDTTQYGFQPSIMISGPVEFFRGYRKWKKAALASEDAIVPSEQDIGAFRAAQEIDNSKLNNRIAGDFQCDNYQITFGDEE